MAAERQTWAQRWGSLVAPALTMATAAGAAVWWAATMTNNVNLLREDMSQVKIALGIAKPGQREASGPDLPVQRIVARAP